MNGDRKWSRDARGGQEKTGVSRRHGHDPVPSEIDVDGVPMAVDRCRDCGIVVLDPGRPGGPCPGPNHTLTQFGVVPPADGETHEEAIRRDENDERAGTAPLLASR